MRYGLPREEKRKKKWKVSIENELKCLQMEVCFLKEQLNEATNQLTQLASFKQSNPSAFTQGFPNDKTSNYPQSYDIPIASTSEHQNCNLTHLNTNSNERFLNCGFDSSSGFPSNKTPIPQNDNNFPPTNGLPRISTKRSRCTTTRRRCKLEYSPVCSVGTERYQSTWDYDTATKKAMRYDSITCMLTYNNKSLEELRFEDYVLKGISFANQIQRYKDFQQRSSRKEIQNFSFQPKSWKPLEIKGCEKSTTDYKGRFVIPWYLTPKQPKAPWPFGPSPESNRTSNLSATDYVGSDLSDGGNESNSVGKPNKSEPFLTFLPNSKTQNNCDNGIKVNSDMKVSTKDEVLSSQILLELKKVGQQISTISNQLSKMDSNLSDVSSRVSVMDSRLSAVDMFVTMQRFDQKWQGLETRLVDLENSSLTKAVLQLSGSISKADTTLHTRASNERNSQSEDITSVSDDKKLNDPQTSKLGESVLLPSSLLSKGESFSAMDTSDKNISGFVKSISCSDMAMESKILYSSNLSDGSIGSNSPSKIKLENASIEMADLSSINSIPVTSGCSGFRENESAISFSNSVASSTIGKNNSNKKRSTDEKTQTSNYYEGTTVSSVMCKQAAGTPAENKSVDEFESKIHLPDKYNDEGSHGKDPLGVTGLRNSSSTKLDELFVKETENGEDNEFVMVEKSDLEESMEGNSNVKIMPSPSNEASSNSDFKMYNDITEYLEINLGKKKNLVYEFGFEAKPGYLVEPEGSPVHEKTLEEIQETQAATSSQDDSFQQFKINFIESEVDAKQSSPFVLYSIKSPDKSSSKTPFDKQF